jgi:hypothetical protein
MNRELRNLISDLKKDVNFHERCEKELDKLCDKYQDKGQSLERSQAANKSFYHGMISLALNNFVKKAECVLTGEEWTEDQEKKLQSFKETPEQ